MSVVIQEISPPREVSGISSFLVKFEYDPGIVAAIKGLGCAVYLPKERLWEVPASGFAALCDALTFITDLQIYFLPDKTETPEVTGLTQAEIEQFRYRPFEHQITAINFLMRQKKALLLDGCGVGKTNEIIWTAEALKRRGKIDHCLIICGINSIKLNWEREINKFSTETCRVIGKCVTRTGSVRYTTIEDRAKELKNPIEEFFVVLNIESLRDEKGKVLKAIQKSKNHFGMIAVDEIHACSNSQSTQGNRLLKLEAEYKIAATGTLITNSALSAYLPLKFTENDVADLTTYKHQYLEFGGFGNKQVVGQQHLDLLQDEIDSCGIRRTLQDVRPTIPQLQIDFELVEMDPAHQKFYTAIKEGVREEADKIKLNAANLLALTARLRQATALPGILTTNQIESTKLRRCREVVEELVAQGEKVVVFSTFKPPIYELARQLEQFHPMVNTGDQQDGAINANVQKFQSDPEAKVFLATGAKMGVGHTLNASMYLLFLDIPWNWSSFEQQYSRVYRVTNERPAFIKVFGCADTIDEHVWEIINSKKDVADYLVDDKPSASMMEDMKSIIFE